MCEVDRKTMEAVVATTEFRMVHTSEPCQRCNGAGYTLVGDGWPRRQRCWKCAGEGYEMRKMPEPPKDV